MKAEGRAWAILNIRTGKFVGTYFPRLFGTRRGAAKEAVQRGEQPVQVKVVPTYRSVER